MVKASWHGTVIAASNDTVVVEGNHYFPKGAVKAEMLQESLHTTVCPWKGSASYYDVVVDGKINRNAAWYYAQPLKGAEAVADRVAFWQGVQVS